MTIARHPPRLGLIPVTGYGSIYWKYLDSGRERRRLHSRRSRHFRPARARPRAGDARGGIPAETSQNCLRQSPAEPQASRVGDEWR